MINKMVMGYIFSKSLIDLKNREYKPIPARVKMRVIMILVLISYANSFAIIVPKLMVVI